MTADCKTVLKEYPMEHIKKWTYDDKNIILDFGEYEVAPFYGITPQRAEISELLGGYIDIILKKMKARASGQDEEDSIAEETSVGTVRGTLTSGFTSSTTKSSTPAMKLQQICDFISGSAAIQSLFVPLDELRQIHIDGMKVSLSEEQMFSQIQTNAATLSALIPEAMKVALSGEFARQIEIAKQIAAETAKLTSSAQMAAFGYNLDPEQQRVVMEASQAVNEAMIRYLNALEALKKDPKNPALLSAAQAAAFEVEAAIAAFSATATGTFLDVSSQQLLAELAKNVALAVNNLTQTASATARAPNPQFNATLVQADAQAQALVASSGILGGLTANDKCKAKLTEAMEKVRAKAIEVVRSLGTAQGDVTSAGAWQREVESALAQMAEMMSCPRFEGSKEFLAYLSSANAVLEETSAIINSSQLSMESAQQASRVIQQNYPVLVSYAKQLAQTGDDMTRDRALEASQQIHTTARSIASIVDGAQDGISQSQMEKLVDDSTSLNSAVQHLLGENGNQAAKLALIDCAKSTAQASVALVRASTKLANGPARATNGPNLLQAAANAVASIKALSESIINASSDEGDTRAKTNHLVEVAEWFCPQIQDGLLQSTRDSLESCQDGDERREAIVASQAGHKALARLEKAAQAYKTVGNYNDIEWATEGFRAALADLEWTEMALEVGEVLKGGKVDTALESMVAVAARFGQSIKGVAASLKTTDKPIAESMQDLSTSCQGVSNTVKNLVAASKYSREQKTIVEAGRLLFNEVNRLISSIKSHALNPSEQNLQQAMGCIAASAVALQKLSRTAKQLEGVPLAEGESEANLPQSDIALETKAEEILEKLCGTSDKAVANIRVSLERAKEQAGEDPKAQVQVAVLEALSALMGTASNVVQASYSAQAELVQSLSAPATRAMYARDPKMAQGLIEACAQVSTAISSLGGDLSASTQKEMISQAESIAKACEVLAFATRAGTRSANQDSTRRLMEAAQRVSESVKLMVAAAQQVEDVPDIEDDTIENYGIDAATLKEIKQMMKIVDLEKQLSRVRFLFSFSFCSKIHHHFLSFFLSFSGKARFGQLAKASRKGKGVEHVKFDRCYNI